MQTMRRACTLFSRRSCVASEYRVLAPVRTLLRSDEYHGAHRPHSVCVVQWVREGSPPRGSTIPSSSLLLCRRRSPASCASTQGRSIGPSRVGFCRRLSVGVVVADEYCIHEMPAAVCGFCNKVASPEEEAKEEGRVTGGIFGRGQED